MKKSCDERMWHSSMVLGPEDEKKTGQGEAAGGVGGGTRPHRTVSGAVQDGRGEFQLCSLKASFQPQCEILSKWNDHLEISRNPD